VFDAECVNYFLIEQLKVVHLITFVVYFNLIFKSINCSYRSQDEMGDKKKTSTKLDTEEAAHFQVPCVECSRNILNII
jgi:hypothetical protein